jgi:thioredoxin 1
MIKNSSLGLSLLFLIVFTGCDYCKNCKECEEPKNKQTAAEDLATKTTVDVINVTTKEEFKKEVLESDIPVIVDFYANFCGACKIMKPIFQEAANTLGDKLKFVEICSENADEQLFIEYGIRGVPTFIIFKDGKKQDEYIGSMDKKDFIKSITKSLEEIK